MHIVESTVISQVDTSIDRCDKSIFHEVVLSRNNARNNAYTDKMLVYTFDQIAL